MFFNEKRTIEATRLHSILDESHIILEENPLSTLEPGLPSKYLKTIDERVGTVKTKGTHYSTGPTTSSRHSKTQSINIVFGCVDAFIQ